MVKGLFFPAFIWAITFGQGPLPPPSQTELQWHRVVVQPLEMGILTSLRALFERQIKRHPLLPSDPSVAPGRMELQPQTNLLPTLMVDQELGAVFPKTPLIPQRPSFVADGVTVFSKLKQIFIHLMAGELLAAQEALHATYELLRYSATWINDPGARRAPSPPFNLTRDLQPKRKFRPDFLPLKLEPGTVILPLATPLAAQTTRAISDRWKAEITGALDTHWNQSAFAKKHRVQFKIRWKDFQLKDRFPPGFALLVAGGKTTHVSIAATTAKAPVLYLGADTLNPRTLAHELGHLLGFVDCYQRTLQSLGIFGVRILEWDNPYFDDELMCNNQSGVAQSLVW